MQEARHVAVGRPVITSSVSGRPCARRLSSAIEKPRSGAPLRHLRGNHVESSSSAGVASPEETASVVYPAFSSRWTDWRTLRIARPSR